jgi:hypothetical protein
MGESSRWRNLILQLLDSNEESLARGFGAISFCCSTLFSLVKPKMNDLPTVKISFAKNLNS